MWRRRARDSAVRVRTCAACVFSRIENLPEVYPTKTIDRLWAVPVPAGRVRVSRSCAGAP